MRAAVRCAAPMPSPSSSTMFLTFAPPATKGTTSKLPRAVTVWPSLCVALTLNSWSPGFVISTARTVAMAAFSGRPLTQPLAQLRSATVATTGLPSIMKLAAVMDLAASSGRSVACRSKRWPGRKRAMTGAALPDAKSSLGGVRRLTLGAAAAAPASAASKGANRRRAGVSFMVVCSKSRVRG